LRDDDGITSDVVGVYDVRGLPAEARGGQWVLRFERGASLTLSVGPPTPRLGMGVRFEVHGDRLVVLSVEYGSSARVAGLRAGDRIVAINGRAISSMTEGEARQGLDRGAMQDVSLTVQHEGSASTEPLTIRRDALYPSR
jgi:C-terminal processing protease CtpA/Prc